MSVQKYSFFSVITISLSPKRGIIHPILHFPPFGGLTCISRTSTFAAFTVTSNISWTVSSTATAWFTLSTTSGTKDGTVTVTSETNTSITERTATIVISGGEIIRTISVKQAGATPILSVSLSSLSFPSSTERQKFAIESNTSWTVSRGTATWYSVSPTSGSDNDSITVNAYNNSTTAKRTGIITVSGGDLEHTISVEQAEAAPSLTVSSTSMSLSAYNILSTSFNITSNTSWTVGKSASASWLTVSPTSCSNSGRVTATVTPNSSTTDRTAIITVSGAGITQAIDLKQAGATLDLSTTAINFSSSSSQSTFEIRSNYLWSTEVNDAAKSWLTLSSYTGSNNTIVRINVTENTTRSERTATLTVTAGSITKTIKVTQTPSTYLTVSPVYLSFSSSGEQKTISIESNVNWAVSIESAPWLTVSSASGSNNGAVTVTVTANTSSSDRTTTITVSGGGITKNVNVRQDKFTPSLTVSRSSINFSPNQEQVTFNITSNTNWTVSRGSTTWLTVSPASGSNNGTVTVSAAANTSTSNRTATITVSGGDITRTINVTQAGAFAGPGSITFWTSKDFGCGFINVTLTGQGTQTIRGYYVSGTPGCGDAFTATFSNLIAATYTYTASCSGRSWSGTVT